MQEFDTALSRALTDPAHTPEQRRKALVEWANLPEARFAQPREEHLLPLHVVRLRPLKCRGHCLRWSTERTCRGRALRRHAGAQARGICCCCMLCFGRVAYVPNAGLRLCIDCMACVTFACRMLDIPLRNEVI